MAASREAQEVRLEIACEICESVQDVKWKCADCDEWLCHQCFKVHSKSKASRDHTVIPIGETDLIRQPKGTHSPEECDVHPSEHLQMYCKDCQCPVCHDCITEHHQNHAFSKLSDVVNRAREELSQITSEIQKVKIKDFIQSLVNLTQNEKEYDTETDAMISKIQVHADKMKKEIEKVEKEFVSEIQITRANHKKKYLQMKQQLETEISDLKCLLKECEGKIKVRPDPSLLKFVNDIKSKLHEHSQLQEPVPSTVPLFVPQVTETETLKGLFGYLQKDTTSGTIERSLISVDYVTTFNHREFPSRIVTCGTDQAWITSGTGGNQISLVSLDGSETNCAEMDGIVNDIAITTYGEILLAVSENTSIINMSKTGKITNFMDMSPFVPCGLCRLSDDAIMATLINHKAQYGKIVKVSNKGKILNTIENDSKGNKLVKDPSTLTVNTNGDIWFNDSKQTVVVSKDGRLRFTYKGPTSPVLIEEFNPYGISSTKFGQVLICDHANDVVHLVDKDGNFIKFLLTKEEHGIYIPNGIDIDSENKVWVTCDDYLGKVVVAKCSV